MNRVLTPEMLHCMQTSSTSGNHHNINNNNHRFNNGTDLTVLERQRARQKWQQQQQHQQQENEAAQTYFTNDAHFANLFQLPLTTSNFDPHQGFMNDCMIREFVNRSMKTDPSLENEWSTDFGKYPVPKAGYGEEIINTTGLSSASNGFVSNNINSVSEMSNFSISRTTSCPPIVGDTLLPAKTVAAVEETSKEICSPGKMSSIVGKKRKADKAHNSKVNGVAEDLRDKRIKVDITEEVESKITHEQPQQNKNSNSNNRENSSDASKDNNSKISEVQKPDYIHVRARRGQATDSHSLAERVRREKISERMKYLQDLVPGCNKITGKAGMLDEIINYVQSLQRQVEFLSMKLATVNPRLDVNIDNFFAKDMFPSATSGIFPNVGMLPADMVNCSTYLQSFNPTVQEMISSCGLDMVINPPEMAAALRRTISAPPLPLPDTFLDASCFTQDQPTSTTWETDLQNIYSIQEFPQGRAHPTVFPHQSYTGSMEGNNLKMEM
ncbi:hypothetical protein MKW94_017558 [Papaver nudicaule]|uniref:BHLH domain-containing protein n=1 Tax=Papaver nudicaule TaxID=74823 RepID=A0AA42B0S6_PAPNU|nr:hypothetical protein [Papaver nudicaule]